MTIQPMDAITSQTLPDMGTSWARAHTPSSTLSSTGSWRTPLQSSEPLFRTDPYLARSLSSSHMHKSGEMFLDQRFATSGSARVGDVESPSSPSFARGGMMSDIVRRENATNDKYSRQIELGADAAGPSGSGSSDLPGPEATSDFMQVLPPQAFLDDVRVVEESIQDLSKSIRLEHLDGSALHTRQNSQLEAVRRRREEDIRRARKLEQQARDPHRKIQLKLENRRRFSESTHRGVPMQVVDIVGRAGKEEVSMVDTRALRGRCLGMDAGDRTVAQLLDRRMRKCEAAKLRDCARRMRSCSSASSCFDSAVRPPPAFPAPL